MPGGSARSGRRPAFPRLRRTAPQERTGFGPTRSFTSNERMFTIGSGGTEVPRPFCCRKIAGRPAVSIFKPIGIPVTDLEEIVMTLDEFEALRLADLDGLYQEQAAGKMKISRPTFSRVVESAR